MYSIVVQLVVEGRTEVQGAGAPDPPINRPAPIGSRLCQIFAVMMIVYYNKYQILFPSGGRENKLFVMGRIGRFINFARNPPISRKRDG